MSVITPNPAFAGPPPSGVQARLQYQQQRQNAVAQYTQPAAVFSYSGPLLVDGEYTSAAFGLPQAANRVILQATFSNLSGTLRFWLVYSDTEQSVANLTPGVSVRVTIPVGRQVKFRASGRSDDAVTSIAVFAKYERV